MTDILPFDDEELEVKPITPINLIEIDGLKFYTRPKSSDQIIVQDNLVLHNWEKHGVKIVAGDAWLDFGGYIGTFSARLLSLGARVCAFEADPLHAEIFRNNMALNNFGPPLFEFAIMNKCEGPKMLTRNDYKGNWAANTIQPYWKRSRASVQVECMAFEEAFMDGITLLGAEEVSIKMDIEGSEIEILENLNPELPIKQLAFEYHYFLPESTCERYWAIQKKLEGMGFLVKTSDKVPLKGPWMNPRKRHMMCYCTKPEVKIDG